MKILFALNAGIAVGKITKSFLEDKIGCFGATVAGEIAGVVTAGVTLCLSITVSLVSFCQVCYSIQQKLLPCDLIFLGNLVFVIRCASSIVCRSLTTS